VAERDLGKQERMSLAMKGQALEDGSYPIPDVAHLHSAIVLAQSGHGDVAGAKRLIKKRATELGASDALPESWKD
jgi:hypothetical protein